MKSTFFMENKRIINTFMIKIEQNKIQEPRIHNDIYFVIP